MSIDPLVFLQQHAKAHPTPASVLTTQEFVRWWDQQCPSCALNMTQANLILHNLTTTQAELSLATEFDAERDLCWSYTMK
ncbi:MULTISPECIES: hypothetical protein [Vibrio]|uniref:Uncharacterized protein n=1 Tax=Vibrio coralliilyticus TaxID=190893 RepID=A0AAN0W1X2_9VIBR|nr:MULTISPECIES: hypothetical protein [Vibrio]AIW22971.1 hypothetical protein IX92_28545 [Vibrio coralliilyticus]MCM5510986.1 hypothetical protein [Vibrio sp. SCSIO 43169]NOH38249.1 hypothetical protein [Vibrio coralliilyticus]NOH55038.1 hypothetical protein [Vibrio coralliilyticus]QFT39983.1 hypothetical protein FIU99_26700 [Vibrio sp. THAF64]